MSDRYKIFTSNWLWIEICENAVLSKIDITMTTINKKNFEFDSLRSRRMELVGTRKNGRVRRRHATGEVAPARKAPENCFRPLSNYLLVAVG